MRSSITFLKRREHGLGIGDGRINFIKFLNHNVLTLSSETPAEDAVLESSPETLLRSGSH